MTKWFRHDASRKAGQTTRSRIFTLGGLVGITALLAVVTALIALPLQRTRERQMLNAARAQVHAINDALEAYRGVFYRFPDRIADLRSVGYSVPPSVVVCHFTHVADARNFDDHVEFVAHHRASDRALVARYPTRGRISERERAAACATATEPSE
jgi:hypothetical protein